VPGSPLPERASLPSSLGLSPIGLRQIGGNPDASLSLFESAEVGEEADSLVAYVEAEGASEGAWVGLMLDDVQVSSTGTSAALGGMCMVSRWWCSHVMGG
jgi:hypothetical protein